MSYGNVYIESHPLGSGYIVTNNGRQWGTFSTQAEAIGWARANFPGVEPNIERVRHTTVGKPDQWRGR